jgi:hypothetical protein
MQRFHGRDDCVGGFPSATDERQRKPNCLGDRLCEQRTSRATKPLNAKPLTTLLSIVSLAIVFFVTPIGSAFIFLFFCSQRDTGVDEACPSDKSISGDFKCSMLRLRRPLCSPLPYFRQCQGVTRGFANVHHVKFKRPWIRYIIQFLLSLRYAHLTNLLTRRFATTCLLYGAAFHLWSSLLYLQFDGNTETDRPDDKTANKGVSQVAADNVIEEDCMFIPLGWPRIRPGEPYAPSDAEWKEFVKMAQDKQRLKSLRGMYLDALS